MTLPCKDKNMDLLSLTIAICFGLAVTVSGLIVTVRVRRRMKRSLGRRASSLDLVSFKAWNRVEETEERNVESGPIHPK